MLNRFELIKRVILVICALVAQIAAVAVADAQNAAGGSGVDKAREALTQKEDDASDEKNLEEIFEASERTYSLLKKGKYSMTYSFDHSYFQDAGFDVEIDETVVRRFDIQVDAQHTFSSNLSVDYGYRDNITFNVRLPFVLKYDTQNDINTSALGDLSASVRWQPFPVKRGVPATTLFSSLSMPTGNSPYKIDVNEDLSTGSGYYALSFGVNASQVKDPVVLFGSLNFSHNLNATGLNQNRSGAILKEVNPGDSISLSMGMAYSLSYDISVSTSLQYSYTTDTEFIFESRTAPPSEDQFSSVLNFSVGVRTSPSQILNVNIGFGLTEYSSDVILGFSLPIDIASILEKPAE